MNNVSGALIEILKRGGCYWPRPPGGPGRALAIPAGTRFRIARDEPASAPFVSGACGDGVFAIADGDCAGRTFDTAAQAVAAVRGAGDAFACVEFLAGSQWLSADSIRRSGALPWGEADELALEIAIDAVRDKSKDAGERLTASAAVRKAAEVLAVSPYFLDEARQRLEWIRK